jgi:hypothetical protein
MKGSAILWARERESAWRHKLRKNDCIYIAPFLHLHSDLIAWIIEVHCLAEVDSFLVATSPCKVWGPHSVLPELSP